MRDSEVVASIVAGDPDGLGLIAAYDRYADPLYKYCRTLLSDPADAADAVQDTFVIAASKLDELRDPDRLRAWLYAVARNEALRILRAKKGTSALDEAPDVTDDSIDVAENAERADLRKLLEDAAGGLNPGDREVIELQLRQGLEPAEVATVLGVSHNHAHTLFSRARDQLETCLAALLVSRSGREDCGELGTMLTGWDGRLTVLLRKRVHRHIEHCATCTARRDYELRPAMLLDLSPAVALAAGAAASLQLAVGVPDGLKAHTITLATGQGAGAVAHRAAVLGRAGAFAKSGFPKSTHGAGTVDAAAHHGGVTGLGNKLRSSRRGQTAAAAAVVLAVIIAAIAFALTGNAESVKPAASDPKPPPAPPAISVTTPSPKPTTPKPTPPATTSAPPPPSPTTAATTPPPPPLPTPSVGTLEEYPQGGSDQLPQLLMLVPGEQDRQIDLSAKGTGDWSVSWSVAVTNDSGDAVSVSPTTAGTLTAADPTATLTITVSKYLSCGPGFSGCPTITVSPTGAVYTVWTGFSLPLPPVPVPVRVPVPVPAPVPGRGPARGPGVATAPGAGTAGLPHL